LKTELKDFGTLHDKETYIGRALMYFQSNAEKERALWYTLKGKEFNDVKERKFRMEGEEVLKLYNKGMAYNVVSTLLVWNEWYEEAYALESFFITPNYWTNYPELVEQYLELLIIKGQNAHVRLLFSNEDFRNLYATHFEVFNNITNDNKSEEPKSEAYKALVAKLSDLYDKYAEGD
jgi:hypothetical protein